MLLTADPKLWGGSVELGREVV
ncbi:hypothetical protein MRI28_07690 [Nocardiopsis dassonvillei]|nr:hypothetical protein [Nocardiopsis dassonvillei]